jgi:hypothetical protein
MARNDPYLPAPVNVAAGGSTTFDGSAAGTGTAIVSGLQGSFDAEVRVQAYDGANWQTVGLLTDDAGNTTLTADWATQFNRLMVSTNDRRLKVDNVDTASGWVAADGDER